VKDLTKADLELVSVTSQAPSPCLLPLLVLTGTGAWLGGASPATRHRQNPKRTEGGAVRTSEGGGAMTGRLAGSSR
jgi:hypothetical protein